MEQLTFGNLLDFAKELEREGISMDEIRSLPIYLGDDDELNGIHCGWYRQVIDADEQDDRDLVELINESRGNISLEKGEAILIS